MNQSVIQIKHKGFSTDRWSWRRVIKNRIREKVETTRPETLIRGLSGRMMANRIGIGTMEKGDMMASRIGIVAMMNHRRRLACKVQKIERVLIGLSMWGCENIRCKKSDK
jgi:hypothetical protein